MVIGTPRLYLWRCEAHGGMGVGSMIAAGAKVRNTFLASALLAAFALSAACRAKPLGAPSAAERPAVTACLASIRRYRAVAADGGSASDLKVIAVDVGRDCVQAFRDDGCRRSFTDDYDDVGAALTHAAVACRDDERQIPERTYGRPYWSLGL
jgi:hypothetical protein